MKNLRINLLGPPEILWEEQRLNIYRRTPRTLFYYLAAQSNLIGREKLLAIFWEDTPPEKSRRRLREALSRIRSTIPLEEFFEVNNDLIGLNSSILTVDIKDFVEINTKIGTDPWTTPTNQALPDDIQQPMKTAVEIWRGTRFLEGADLPNSATLEDWRYQTNMQLTGMRTRMLTRLSDHYFVLNQLEESLKYSQLAVESDEFNEEFHFRVMKILVGLQRFQDAHQYYIYVTKLLKEELDSSPSQQLVSLYRQVQKQLQGNSTIDIHHWRVRASVSTPFVGRVNEISQLNHALVKGGGVIVSGESGLGKTRLIQEFCNSYTPGRKIINSHCRPSETNLPFQTFIDLLRNNVHSNEWDELPNTWVEPLSILLPERNERDQQEELSPQSILPDQNRSAIFESIRQVFLILAKNDDLILFIDDLHWSDEASLSTIAYLLDRAPFNKQSLIILASRSEESNPNLGSILLSNHTSLGLDTLELSRLNSVDIARLGRYVLGYPIENAFSERLSLETGGNPFIILETLRGLQISGSLATLSEESRLPLVSSVFSLIKNRLRQLSPAARNVCEYAAVIGIEFDPVLISQASNQNLTGTFRAIEELNQRQLIEPNHSQNQEPTWRFVHDKIRESILQDTHRIHLRSLHERVAQAIEKNQGTLLGSQAALLARHYEYAGRISTAFQYWLQAAQWARRLYSSQEAIQILALAEKLIFFNEEFITNEQIHDLYIEWGELALEIQDAELIREINSRLLELGRTRGSNLIIGTALDGLSLACFVENQYEDGLTYANQAISYLEQTTNMYERMNSYTNRGIYLYMLGRLNEAIQAFEHVLSFGTEDNDPAILKARANAHYQLALSQTLAGWPEIGLDNAKHALWISNKIGHHHIKVTAYLASSLAYYFSGDNRNSRHATRTGMEIIERLQANRMLGYLLAVQTFLDIAEGNLGTAYELSQQILDLGLEHQHQDLLSLAHRIRGDIYLLLDSFERARAEFEEGFEFGDRDFWGLDNLVRLGYSQVKTDQTELGMANIHRGIDLAQSTGFGLVEIRGMQFLSYAHLSIGERKIAQQVAEKIQSQAQIRNLPIEGLLARYIATVAAVNQSNLAENLDQLQYLLTLLSEKDQPYIAIRVLHQIIRVKQKLAIDPVLEVNRVHDILEYCEPLAFPQTILDPFQEYKQQIEASISG